MPDSPNDLSGGCEPPNPRTIRRVQFLRDRDGDLCWVCALPMDFSNFKKQARQHAYGPSVDHVIEKCYGGRSQAWNLRLAHYFCNAARSCPKWNEAKWRTKVWERMRHVDPWVAYLHTILVVPPLAGDHLFLRESPGDVGVDLGVERLVNGLDELREFDAIESGVA